jgi:hypothetical protein
MPKQGEAELFARPDGPVGGPRDEVGTDLSEFVLDVQAGDLVREDEGVAVVPLPVDQVGGELVGEPNDGEPVRGVSGSTSD